MVSVIVPVYNLEKYIEKCISSILSQTYRDIELIIVNDGSTDKTEEICKRYQVKNKNIVYVSKKNQGQGVARMVGLTKAKGEYVLFVDGDDWLEGDAVENMFLASQNGLADVVVGDMYYVYCEGEEYRKIYSKIRCEDGKLIPKNEYVEKINRFRTFTCGKMFRRAFLEEKEFKQELTMYEDLATIPLLIAKASFIKYVNKPVYNYLRNRSSSNVNNIEKVKDLQKAIECLYEGFVKLDNYEMYIPELKRLMWSQIRFACISSKMSWSNAKDDEKMSKVLEYVSKIFPEFVYPEDCDITLINNNELINIVKCILIDTENVRIENNEIEYELRINTSYSGKVNEYIVKNQKLDFENETDLWNEADMWFGRTFTRGEII